MANQQKRADVGGGYGLVIAGGGTGGHLFPGISVAQAFAQRHQHNRVLFVNAGRSLEKRVLTDLGWSWKTIPIEGIKGRSRWRQMVAAMKIPKAVWQSSGILKRFGADVVLGVGGYSAGPVVLAAWRRGLATALHEQNQLPGVTNRLLSRLVDRIYLSFSDSRNSFAKTAVKITGNPVRDEIIALASDNDRPLRNQEDAFNILIVGGSQGAHAINTAMVQALPLIKRSHLVQVVHQTGEQDLEMVQHAYASSAMSAVVQPFFKDMAKLYREADLIVCRAGATTVAEITVVGRAALFIPFPYAADDHQTRNAQALVDAGAAQMIAERDLDGRALAQEIDLMMQNRSRLLKMEHNARALGRPDAAQTIVDDLYSLLQTQ